MTVTFVNGKVLIEKNDQVPTDTRGRSLYKLDVHLRNHEQNAMVAKTDDFDLWHRRLYTLVKPISVSCGCTVW